MADPWEALRKLAQTAPVQDWMLAAGLLGVAQVETWASPTYPAKTPMALIAAAMIIPLVWRRRAPVLVLVVGLAAGLVFGSTWPSVEPIYQIVALLIACYSLGVYADFTPGLVSVVGVVCIYIGGAVLDRIRASGRHGPGDVSMLAFLVFGAWLLGGMVERRSDQAAAMAARADQLEREQQRQEAEALALERARIARELHDVIAHSVSVMVIQAGAAERQLEGDPARAREPLLAIQELGSVTVDELRRMLGILRDDEPELSLNPQPGLAGLPQLIAHFGAAGMAVELTVEGTEVPLPPGIDLSAYRIVQEALTNILKHAVMARHVRVRVRYPPPAVEIAVSDDGAAVTTPNGQGHGLIGMRERAGIYGGTFTAGPQPGGGYRVTARLPLVANR